MSDMTAVTAPKSDQINADDLIPGPRTIRISRVDIRPGTEQPVSVHYDGEEGRPYKPCKSMCRVMVALWGADAGKYVGRSMTLYRDPSVKWGGMEVGGIRISHMTDIAREFVMALTATKGSRKPFTVRPLEVAKVAPALLADAGAAACRGTAAYQDFFMSLSRGDKNHLVESGDHARLKADAAKAVVTSTDQGAIGRACALAGGSRTECPADLTPEDRAAWLSGFDAADSEAGQPE